MAGILDHRELAIVEGVAATPGDTNSIETPLIVLNLKDNISGIALDGIDGWSPKIPSIENSGIWADSPLTPGRQLLVAEEGNVTETMHLLITGSSLLGVIKTLDTLYILANDAREFWTNNTQINPVFLKWWASCGVGPQYARIFNMTIDPTYVDAPVPTIKATITIEREPYWLGLPPGSNPKQWYYENVLKQAWNTAVTALVTGTDHLAVGSVLKNCLSWVSRNVPSNLNYVDIPAASVPGDAPALAMITIESLTPGNVSNYFIGLSTKPATLVSRSGGATTNRCITFNAADASGGTDFTVANDAGGVGRLSTGLVSRAEISYATATDARRMSWLGTNANQPMIEATLTRGRYAAFIRCRQTAVTAGDIKMYLKYGINGTTTPAQTNEVNPVVQAGAGDTTAWPITYMGIVDIPLYDRMTVDSTGHGLFFSDLIKDFSIELWSRRTAGASLLYVCDLLLFPVDEAFAQCIMNDGTPTYVTLDNTGYYGHGDMRDLLIAPSTTGTIQENVELLGTGIQLQPGVLNRLHILGYDSSNTSRTQTTMTVRVDIIPRWRGIRDS